MERWETCSWRRVIPPLKVFVVRDMIDSFVLGLLEVRLVFYLLKKITFGVGRRRERETEGS